MTILNYHELLDSISFLKITFAIMHFRRALDWTFFGDKLRGFSKQEILFKAPTLKKKIRPVFPNYN